MDLKSFGFDDSEILGFSRPRKQVYKIVPELQRNLFADCPESVKTYARTLRDNEWRFHVVDQDTGWCRAYDRTIVIPAWLWKPTKTADYRVWYISHELAHAFDECKHNHGPEFMSWLKEICPANMVHHELGYKPRLAAQAEIRNPGDIDPIDTFDL